MTNGVVRLRCQGSKMVKIMLARLTYLAQLFPFMGPRIAQRNLIETAIGVVKQHESKHKDSCQSWELNPEILNCSLERYLSAIESTENITCSQAIELFQLIKWVET